MTEQRRLATILSLDVVGYSRAAEKDDGAAAAAVRRLGALVAEIAGPFGGRIFSTAGDGFMLEFPSAASGVDAAMALLKEAKSGTRQMPMIRIGMHLGDVIVEENGDLLGHGVNVAARLQALAEPGSAVVSETVRAQVRQAGALRFRPQGRVQLDKMSERLEVFAIGPDGATGLGKIGRRRLARFASITAAVLLVAVLGAGAWKIWGPIIEEPRLAVLRFESLGDSEPYFAEGVADELISEISRINGLQVTARSSSFALTGDRATPQAAARELNATMVLTGSVRAAANGLRVQAQLVEAPTGRLIWSQAFDRPLAEVYALQRDIAVRVAQALDVRIEPGETPRVDPRAYRAYLEGRERYLLNGPDALASARDSFRAAVELDPTFARAWSSLAISDADVVWKNMLQAPPGTELTEAMYADALAAADRAIALDPDQAAPYQIKAVIYVHLGRWRDAAAQSELARGKRDSRGNFTLSLLMGYIGDAHAELAEMSHNDPLSTRVWMYVDSTCTTMGDHRCQLDAMTHAFNIEPDDPVVLGYYYYALVAANEIDRARQIRAEHGEQLNTFYEINAPMTDAYFLSLTGDGPPPPAAQILSAVARGEGYVDPAIEMLVSAGDWNAAAGLLDQWSSDSRPALPLLYRAEWAPIRRSPQFWALMEREGLLAHWRSSGHWPDFCARETVCQNR